MDLVQVKGNTWCLTGMELIPVYRLDERRCILMDSGWPWEREALQSALDRAGLLPVGLIGSHAHTDHAGNHAWLKERYGVHIAMSEAEAVQAKHLELLMMAYGPLSMNAMAETYGDILFCTDRILPEEDGDIVFLGVPFRIHHTTGHSPGHVCIGTPDGVCYVGDLVMTGRTRREAQLPYHFIHREARASMEKMRHVEGYSHYIVAHRKIVEELDGAVEKNLVMLDEISSRILSWMDEPLTWEEVMRRVLEHTQLFTSNERKYYMYERAAQGFVNDLRDIGKVTVEVSKGIRRFRRVEE